MNEPNAWIPTTFGGFGQHLAYERIVVRPPQQVLVGRKPGWTPSSGPPPDPAARLDGTWQPEAHVLDHWTSVAVTVNDKRGVITDWGYTTYFEYWLWRKV